MGEFEWSVPESIAALGGQGTETNIGGIGIFGNFRSNALTTGDLITTMLRFEENDGITGDQPARDSCGSLDDTYAPSGTSLPSKEVGAVGLAAVFDSAAPDAYEAKDLVSGGTLHTRDVTIQAIIDWDITAQSDSGDSGSLIARGKGNSTSEYMPFAIELVVVDEPTRVGQIRFLWHSSAGVLKTQTGANWTVPASGYVMLTATRRWVSPTEVVLRYYLNERLLAEVTSADGDIAGGASGHTTIGTRYTGAAYERFLDAKLDELAIANYEMTNEEIAATWFRISYFQPDGYRQMRDLMQPGIPISDDPASKIQQDLRVMGTALGFADGLVENMRQNLMPDRAYGEVLRRWERITRKPPAPGDSVDRRRARVLAQLGTRNGVSVPGVREALHELLDCDPEDLEIIAFDNTVRDDFAALELERWRVDPGADWSVITNTLRVQAAAGSFPWDWPDNPRGGKSAVMAFDDFPPVTNKDQVRVDNGITLIGSIIPTTLPAGAEAGIVLWDWWRNDLMFYGLRNTAGAYSFGRQRYRDRAEVEAWTSVASSNTTHYMRVRPSLDQSPAIATDSQWYDLSWTLNTDPAEDDYNTTLNVAWARSFGWGGFYFRTHAATGGASDVRFDSHAFRTHYGSRPFYLYVYRDPGLGGAPDIEGANRVLRRMKHGFTHAAVITSLSLMTDQLSSPVDNGPMGAL